MKRQKHPVKAVVLAAGFGTRLLPLTLETPKPMLSLWGKPVLGHVLDWLEARGVREALINLHHGPDSILDYARRRSSRRLRLRLSFEPDILGTGGALRKADWFLDNDPFWMINADVAADVDAAPFLRAFAGRRTLAALWLHPARGPRTVELKRGLIASFQSSRPASAGTYTFCGLQLLSPDILNYIPPSGFSTIVEAYTKAMEDGRQIRGVSIPDSFWADIGTPEDYLQAHRDILERAATHPGGCRLLTRHPRAVIRRLKRSGIRVEGFVSLGRDARLEPGAVIRNSVIGDGAVLASDAVADHALVGAGAVIHGHVRRLAVRSDLSLAKGRREADIQLQVVLGRLGWPLRRTTIIPLEPRGSARQFTRIRSGGRSAIFIRYSTERAENTLYARHARFLKRLGVNVPEVLLDLPAQRALVLEDLDDRPLQTLIAAGTPAAEIDRLYTAALDQILLLHRHGWAAARRCRLELVPPFSRDLYRWEREFFARHYLENRLRLSARQIRAVLKELAGVGARLESLPGVLIHRDLQSSNILFVGGRPYFIDFQGMRRGPAVYDLASLLCDPYVELTESRQQRLLDYYCRRLGRGGGLARTTFWWAAVERLAQALGAYGRLCARPETAWFGRYLNPALRMMHRAVRHVGVLPRLEAVIRRALETDTQEAEPDNRPR